MPSNDLVKEELSNTFAVLGDAWFKLQPLCEVVSGYNDKLMTQRCSL